MRITHSSRYILYASILFLMFGAGCEQKPKAAIAPPKIIIVMKKYTITPAEIHVKAGEATEFEVSTADVEHGFDVPDLKIKESVQPSKPAVFTRTFDKKGTFDVECGVICGPGHDDMKAKIVVE